MNKQIIFEASAFEDFTNWASQDKKFYAKIVTLIKDIQRNPFSGLGKPEPLRHELAGFWSRLRPPRGPIPCLNCPPWTGSGATDEFELGV